MVVHIRIVLLLTSGSNFLFIFTLTTRSNIFENHQYPFSMNKPYHNDQAHIAEEFHFIDEHTAQTARLAYFKINSYKLSLIKAAFSTSKEDLTSIIRSTLLNYTDPGRVLANLGFFDAELEN